MSHVGGNTFAPASAEASYNYNPQLAPHNFYAKAQSSPATRRRRLNLVAIVISFFVPWLLFCGLLALCSFSMHYRYPLIVGAAAFLSLVLVLWVGLVALSSIKARQSGDSASQPSWYCFLFFTSLLAWSLALWLGKYNFSENTQAYYDLSNLNTYNHVDPSGTRGVQVMDGGRVTFEVGTTLDIKRSMGFKNDRTYCAAPIIINDAPLASYDFWAVGVDCCSGDAGDFKCGQYDNRHAHAGLRLMRDDYRPFFRLAVQQIEAKYQLKAPHPLFFHWVEDPEMEMDAYKRSGFKLYFTGMLGHFFVQLVLVVIAAGCFATSGP